jgi:hypothetical protein
VGFISGRQLPVEQHIADEMMRIDNMMLTELMHIPGLLSYSSLELCAGRWYNLVLLSDANVKECFHTLETHRYAAYQLAPIYYAWIRLHHGMIKGGLVGQDMQLLETRYFQFASSQPSVQEARGK